MCVRLVWGIYQFIITTHRRFVSIKKTLLFCPSGLLKGDCWQQNTKLLTEKSAVIIEIRRKKYKARNEILWSAIQMVII